MPVGRRKRAFSFRQGQGAEHEVILSYGNGPAMLGIGAREIAFARSAASDGIDVSLDGVKSRIAAVVEGQELYLRTRNGRFELHWVDPFLEVMKMEQTLRAPFAGVLKAIKCKVGDIVQEGVELAEVEPA
jgi:3-methylcrotonyl-CoA carboxylase alpha subunit